MRFNKITKSLLCLAPTAIIPFAITGCSVYQDMTKGDHTPTYAQASGSMTAVQARDAFFDKAKTQNNFTLDECYWTNWVTANTTDAGTVQGLAEVYYYSYFKSYYVHYDYATVDATNHKISYKITTDIEEDVQYKYLDQGTLHDLGTGVIHYKVEWECKNLEFDISRYTMYDAKDPLNPKTYWLVKPAIYDGLNTWSRKLINDEQINFNARYISESYNLDGIQSYAYEASEAAIMNSERSYETELKGLLNYFCSFYSYYLDKVSYVAQ